MNAGAQIPVWRARRLRFPPIVVAALFALAGIGWVLMTDILLYRLVDDPVLIARFETAKGWLFVAFTATVVFVLTSYAFAELLRSEAMLRAILDSIADGVLLVGGKRRAVVDANPAALKILGAESRDEIVGLDRDAFSRTFHVATRRGHIIPGDEYSSQRALDGISVPPYRGTLQSRAGEPVAVDVRASPVHGDGHGPTDLAVTVIRDVSAEVALDEIRDHIYSSAAHALKTPIATIKMHAQLMESRAIRPDVVNAAYAVNRQASRMQQTVDNLFVLSRLKNGTLTFHMEDLDLDSVVAGALESYDPPLVKLEVGTHPHAFGDEERLMLAVRNLVHAARCRSPRRRETGCDTDGSECIVNVRVDSTALGGGRVTVRARHGDLESANYSFEDEILVGMHVAEAVVEAHAGRSHIPVPEPYSEWVATIELPKPLRRDASLSHTTEEP